MKHFGIPKTLLCFLV